VGSAGLRRRPVAVATSYDRSAPRWERGAGAVYRPLAAALVSSSPASLDGAKALDVGSGTGAVADAAGRLGARVVATDLSLPMLGASGRRLGRAAVADVVALPFANDAFDAVLAGFVINHLDPAGALREMARVVRPGGVVLASTWADGTDPVKSAIDAVLDRRGWTPPVWYRRMQADVLPDVGDPVRLGRLASASGLADVAAVEQAVDLGITDPRAAVAYRLTVAHVADWYGGLTPAARTDVETEAVAAVGSLVRDWRPRVILLSGRSGGQPNR
jgi:ubiquinone/menaquinone biosynthesis C-methylase UbiE